MYMYLKTEQKPVGKPGAKIGNRDRGVKLWQSCWIARSIQHGIYTAKDNVCSGQSPPAATNVTYKAAKMCSSTGDVLGEWLPVTTAGPIPAYSILAC
jgi:hypothetical protein